MHGLYFTKNYVFLKKEPLYSWFPDNKNCVALKASHPAKRFSEITDKYKHYISTPLKPDENPPNVPPQTETKLSFYFKQISFTLHKGSLDRTLIHKTTRHTSCLCLDIELVDGNC